jgi:uncharacterized protein YecE (DUF72 family)
MKRQRRQPRRRGLVAIGTSGYVYKHWGKGAFYPEKLPQSKWFEYYAEYFRTVETNGTFYKLPAPSVFQNWHDRSDKNFIFFVKGSRFVTHFKHLKDPQPALERFFNAVAPLKKKLAGVLWQLPGQWKIDAPQLREFLKTFRDFSATRLVMEFRNPTWFTDEVTAMLREYDAIYCRADMPDFYLTLKIPDTANYVYLRRHGAGEATRYSGNYSDEALQKDAEEINSLRAEGKDVFVYFNNDIGGHALRNAKTLQDMVDRTL